MINLLKSALISFLRSHQHPGGWLEGISSVSDLDQVEIPSSGLPALQLEWIEDGPPEGLEGFGDPGKFNFTASFHLWLRLNGPVTQSIPLMHDLLLRLDDSGYLTGVRIALNALAAGGLQVPRLGQNPIRFNTGLGPVQPQPTKGTNYSAQAVIPIQFTTWFDQAASAS